MLDLLIQNCAALVPAKSSGLRIQNSCDIEIQDQRIKAIVPHQIDPPPAKESISAAGHLAIPGLINTHAHAPMVLFRGLAEDISIHNWFNTYIWPLESNLNQSDVYWGMQLALLEMIEAGVTTVADHYFFMDQAAKAVEEAGTRAALGWAIFGSQGQAGLERAATFAAEYRGAADGRITTWMAPHAPYTCDDSFLNATAKIAGDLEVGIHIHAAEEMGQTEASLAKRGITPIQVLQGTGIFERPTIIAHGCGLLPVDIDILGGVPQVGIAHAPKTYLKLGMGLTPITALRAAGVPIGLATDGAGSNNTLDILESMRLLALTQKHEARDPQVMPLHEVLDIAFTGSAAVLGLGDQLGRLQPGFLADIALLDITGSHHQPLHSLEASLVYNSRAEDVQSVIVNGRLLMHKREHRTLDKKAIIKKVQENMDRLAHRVPHRRIQIYNP